MKNLDIIKAAAKMGYSSILFDFDGKRQGIVVALEPEEYTGFWVHFKETKGLPAVTEYYLDYIGMIKEFIYVGHLFGEPEIPEGQKFRVKETGEIIRFKEFDKRFPDEIECFSQKDFDVRYCKSEIEPVFE